MAKCLKCSGDIQTGPVEILVRIINNNIELEGVRTNKHINDCSLVLEEKKGDNCMLKSLKQTTDFFKITSLILSYCNLVDLPDCLELLHIKKLDLSHNLLNHVPFCILNGFRMLEHLNLSYNIVNTFESVPRCVEYLKVLNLGNNKLYGFPEWILHGKSKNLIELSFNNNKINNQNYIFYKLQVLNLERCCLTKRDLKMISNIHHLINLNIGNGRSYTINDGNSFLETDSLFYECLWFEHINILNMCNIKMHYLPEEISMLVNLKELYIENNLLSWLPDSFTKLHHLEILNISRNNIAYLPKDIGKHRLQRLLASYNYICSIPTFNEHLKMLDLYKNEINDLFCASLLNIQLIDIDQNHCEVTEIENYTNKKNNLRIFLQETERINGAVTTNPEEFNEKQIKFCLLQGPPLLKKTCVCRNLFNIKKKQRPNDICASKEVKNREITSSDEEWTGEEVTCKPTTTEIKYLNDTYLFDDVEI